MATEKPCIFISYRSLEREFALRLHDDLKMEGVDVWLDVKRIISGSPSWEDEIEKGLEESTAMVAVLTPEAVQSRVVRAEWAYFLSKGKPIFPLKLRDTEVPFRLRLIQYVDFRSSYDSGFQKLVAGLIEANQLNPQPDQVERMQQYRAETQSIKKSDVLAASERYQAAQSGVTWGDIESARQDFVNEMVGVRYREKYDPSYYTQRKVVYAHFKNFLSEDKKVMVLTGKAGTGKSTFICNIALNPPDNTAAWLQDCAHLNLDDNASIQDYILKTLNQDTNMAFGSLWQKLHEEDPARKILFIFDAVNEFKSPSLLLKKLSAFVRDCAELPNIKIMVTCRIPHWQTVKRHFAVPPNLEFHTSGPDSYVNVDIFGDDDIKDIYEVYRKAYNIKTPYEQLSDHVTQFITQPLFLKLTAVAYREREIPRSLAIEEVFDEYIKHCITTEADRNAPDFDVYSTNEYRVLNRAVTMMFELASRELELQILREDKEVGDYVNIDPVTTTPYTRLVSEGVFSQRVEKERMEDIHLVFVTYERVFEYLLANMVVGDVTRDKIVEMLRIAHVNSFLQLRGAVEMALSFAIINNRVNITEVVALANLNQSESRQFLSDVIYTIYTSGYRDLAEQIVSSLLSDGNYPTTVLAIQVAYQLRLDEHLIRTALSDDENVRNLSVTFMYQRWNEARQAGRLQDGYAVIEKLADKIRVTRPREATQALASLFVLTVHLMNFIVDDKDALMPLIAIWQGIAAKIPGISVNGNKIEAKRLSKMVLDGFINIMSRSANLLMRNIQFGADDVLEDFWSDDTNRRAFMDAILVRSLEDPEPYEKEIKELMEWDNLLVPYMFANPIIYQLFKNTEKATDLFAEMFYGESKYPARLKYMITQATAYATYFRYIRGRDIPEDYFQTIEDYFIEMWYTSCEINPEHGKRQIDVEGTLDTDFPASIDQATKPILMMEMFQQKQKGQITGSDFIVRFLESMESYPDLISDDDFFGLIFAVEAVAYRGIAEFSILTLLHPTVYREWSERDEKRGLETLAHIRVLFQDEFDSILRDMRDEYPDLLNKVRTIGAIPTWEDTLVPNAAFWILGSTVDYDMITFMNFLILRFPLDSSKQQVIRHSLDVLLTTLFDFEMVKIAVLQWQLMYNPNWNLHAEWSIDPDLINRRQEDHTFWREHWEATLDTYGRGRFYSGE